MSSRSSGRNTAIVLGLIALAIYIGYIAWIGLRF
jgi:hypothetical protein